MSYLFNLRFYLTSLCLSISSLHADVVVADEVPLDYGRERSYTISEKRLARTPRWNPDSGHPVPISPETAAAKARAHIAKYSKAPEDYTLEKLELCSEWIKLPKWKEGQIRWYWVAQFENGAFIAVGGMLPRTRIPVLFDGWSPKLRKIKDEEDSPASQQEPDVEQAGTEQPATRPESKSEGSDKPQPEAEGRSR